MPTLSTSHFPPPVSWEDLELLVWRLFKAVWNDPYAQRNGRTGQEQQGVDIFGRPDHGETWDGIQVKGKHGFFGQGISEQELRAEAQKARNFVPSLKNFIMVTSARRDQATQQIARQITEENLPLGLFSVSVFGWDDIEERLAEFPDVIREHYPEFKIGRAETSSPQSGFAEQLSLAQVGELIRSLLGQSGTIDVSLAANIAPSLDYPPLKPEAYASRQTTLDQISALLEARSWVALVGSTGMGKTLLARSIWETKPENSRYWISFRGQEGRYEYHLDRQLLGTLLQATNDESLIERYHSGRLAGVELTQQLGMLVPQDTLLVIDDLPYLSRSDVLIDRLASLAVAWWNTGGKVLSTSQYEPPTRLLGVLGTHLDRFAVPDMGDQDVEELLVLAGAPPDFLRPSTVRSIVVITRGHPVLVGAAGQWLLRNNWRLDDQAFTSLLSGSALSEPMTEARTKVRGLVTSGAARELLDRLSMVIRPFNHDMVWSVGNVTPPIERPVEQFSDLVGPWIQQLSGDSGYIVSPLLQNAWQAHVPADLQRKIHGAIAQQYMVSQTISIGDAFQISIHLAGSQDWLRLAMVLFQVMNTIKGPQQFERASWVLWFFKPGVQWPDQVPYQIRIVIRAQQVRGLLFVQKSTLEYETDLEALVADAGPADWLGVFYARHLTSFMLDHVPPEVTARRAMQAARAMRMGDPDFLREFSVQPEESFWEAILKVKELAQISSIVEVVREMTVEERKIVFAPHLGTDMARLLVDMCYSIGADQPTDAQDWHKGLRLLSDIHTAGELKGAEVLSWAALRARAMVLADFQGNIQGALSLLEVDFTGVGESYRFLLTYTSGCILLSHDEIEPTFSKFSNALSIPGEGVFPLLLSDALGRGMIASSMAGRFDISIMWGRRALQRGTTEVGVGPCKKIELLGELAWAYWRIGNQKKACGAMYGAVMSLISDKQPDILRHRETWAKIGHVLGWVSSVALKGSSPDITIDGQQYTDPYPGMIYRRAKQVPEFDVTSRLHYLPYQLAMMASGVGVPRLAVAGYRLAADLGRAQGYLVFSAAMDLERAPIEAELGDFDQALDALLSGGMAIPIMNRNQAMALDSLDDPKEPWKWAEVEEKTSIESFYIFHQVILPAFMSLAAKGADRNTGLQALENLKSSVERIGDRLLLADR